MEEAWRVVEGVLADPPSVELYERGTWGPRGADALLDGIAARDDCGGE